MSELGSYSASDEANYEISPAKQKRLQQLFDHAKQMTSKQKYDFDYAHSLLGECCKTDPANLVYCEAMLANLEKKFGGKKRGSFLSGLGSKGALKKAVSQKKWRDAISAGIDLLKSNPFDATVLRGIVDACEALRYNDVGLRYLKNEIEGSPGNVDVVRHAATYLGRVGQFEQAISLWHFVEEKQRGDEQANKMISQLTIDRERRAKGLSTVTNAIDPADAAKIRRRPTEAANSSEDSQERPAVKIQLNEKQKLKAKIEAEPETFENYVKLIDLWCAENKYFEAESVLRDAKEHLEEAPEWQEKFEEVQMLKARHRYRLAEQQAGANAKPQLLELVETAKNDLNKLELDIYTKRLEKSPSDSQLKYEVALRQKRIGNVDAAIDLFDEIAESDEKFLALAYLGKGECLQSRKKYVTALETYEEAVTYADTLSPERHKLLLYRAGVLAQGLKEYRSAVSYLKRLTAIDPNYKDAKLRLDKLKKMR